MRLNPVLVGVVPQMEVVASLPPHRCSACGGTDHRLATMRSSVVVLCVPLGSWHRRYFSVCADCGHHDALLDLRQRPFVDIREVALDAVEDAEAEAPRNRD